MPEEATLKAARRDKRAGKAPSTQAGEFVREEIHHIREGKHGAPAALRPLLRRAKTHRFDCEPITHDDLPPGSDRPVPPRTGGGFLLR